MRPLLYFLKPKREVKIMVQPMYNGSAPMATIPYEKQLIIEAGIPLFELEKRSSSRLDNNDLGYANCRAIKHENSDNIPIQLIWKSGKKGYVRYSRDELGRYVGFCPDDPEWFNRTRLCSAIRNPKLKISKYINELGLVTVGSEITEELNYIGFRIHDWVAKMNGSIVIRSKDEREVQEFVNKKRREGLEIQGPLWSLVEKLERVREFHRHDWMFSPEFQQEMIPEIKKEINQKFNRGMKTLQREKPELEAAIVKMVPEIIQGMSIKQLTDIVKKKLEEGEKGEMIKNGKLFSNGIPLEDLPINKIRTIAVKRFGIKTNKKTREELITLIEKKIKKVSDDSEPEDVNDLLGPPTPEEIKNREALGLPPLETVEKI